jgi:hypothetical protein
VQKEMATVPDLVEAFAEDVRTDNFPALPGTRNYLLNQYITSQDQPAPAVPAVQTLPTQPPGTRRRIP